MSRYRRDASTRLTPKDYRLVAVCRERPGSSPKEAETGADDFGPRPDEVSFAVVQSAPPERQQERSDWRCYRQGQAAH